MNRALALFAGAFLCLALVPAAALHACAKHADLQAEPNLRGPRRDRSATPPPPTAAGAPAGLGAGGAVCAGGLDGFGSTGAGGEIGAAAADGCGAAAGSVGPVFATAGLELAASGAAASDAQAQHRPSENKRMIVTNLMVALGRDEGGSRAAT